jgi:hypothetical protein
MKTKDIKTIDVITKTWFDKVNGNTYFAQRITINRGRKNETTFVNQFQYGYSSYDYFAKQCVKETLNLKTDLNRNYELFSSKKIRFYNEVIRNCKKRDLTHIAEY